MLPAVINSDIVPSVAQLCGNVGADKTTTANNQEMHWYRLTEGTEACAGLTLRACSPDDRGRQGHD